MNLEEFGQAAVKDEPVSKLKPSNPNQDVPVPSLPFGSGVLEGPKFSGLGVSRLPQAGGSFLNLSIRSLSMS